MTNDGQSLQGWGFVTPALLWTIAFFVVPFLVMGAMSLATLEGRTLIWGVSLSNYAEIAEKAYIWRA
ncbi:MAG: ABC transporter permease, partial [Pseudomonadota bacterium]